jgi:hypothetical protein
MTLESRLRAIASRISSELKAHRILINGNAASLSSLTTTNKTDLVAAINEVNAKPSSSVAIDDATTSTTKVWSSTKTNGTINSAVAALINSAPAALDTLAEIATALQADEAGAAAMNTAIGNRVRFDAPQALTTPQQTQALTNIGAQSAVSIGDPEVDYVALFEAGLV